MGLLVVTYRVRDNKDVGARGSIGSSLGEVTDDGGVGVEKVFSKSAS